MASDSLEKGNESGSVGRRSDDEKGVGEGKEYAPASPVDNIPDPDAGLSAEERAAIVGLSFCLLFQAQQS